MSLHHNLNKFFILPCVGLLCANLIGTRAHAEQPYVGLDLVPMSIGISNNDFVIKETVSTTTTTKTLTTTSLIMDDDVDYSALTLRARIGLTVIPDMYPVISLESHLGFDLSDDSQNIAYHGTTQDQVTDDTGTTTNPATSVSGAKDVTLQLDTYVGFYVRGDFRVTDDAAAYLLLGYASAQLAGPFSDYGLPNDDTESSLSYAIGGTYALPWWDLSGFMEYTQIVNGEHFSISGVGLGVTVDIK